MLEYWLILGGWILLIVVAVIIELESYELMSIWFALGGVAALVFFFLEFDLIWQVGAFGVVSAISLFFVRNYIKHDKAKVVATNIDAYKGKEARVCQEFNEDFVGEVRFEGKIWTAVSADKVRFEYNDLVVIVKLEGNKLIVKKEDR